MSTAFFVVAFVAALFLVAAALAVSMLLAPRSYNPQKGEPYECGIPTKGTSWMQFKVGYYLFAILFLMFDVEAIFLFPWAVVLRELGAAGLVNIAFFLLILILGLAYAWKKDTLEWK
ncbi:MAG: NADH-quinone oxidoreductase subunit A [Prevotellaceae bacterium]|jgi:NADH-quinone oxidoreductase subunit A|nr:NADH-quinone oxidoreductase subunit A [Prevotellaceae bacterium]